MKHFKYSSLLLIVSHSAHYFVALNYKYAHSRTFVGKPTIHHVSNPPGKYFFTVKKLRTLWKVHHHKFDSWSVLALSYLIIISARCSIPPPHSCMLLLGKRTIAQHGTLTKHRAFIPYISTCGGPFCYKSLRIDIILGVGT